MTILKFLEHFPDEQSCRVHFKEKREQVGIICKKCSCAKQYWLQAKEQWQCANCRFRSTLRSGTIMESAKLSFHKWYLCMAFMSSTKKGISALEMQRQLGHRRYETIWRLMHKIRKAMGQRDSKYQLNGEIEFDDSYFSKATPESIKNKRGRGTKSKAKVAVIAESTPLEEIETGVKSSHLRYIKMKMIKNLTSEELNSIVSKNVSSDSILFTDKSTSYSEFFKFIDAHISQVSDKKLTKTTLKWVHIAISNAKRTLLGIYHMVKGKYLQAYLDEFCYKLNRRYFTNNLFNRVIIATIG